MGIQARTRRRRAGQAGWAAHGRAQALACIAALALAQALLGSASLAQESPPADAEKPAAEPTPVRTFEIAGYEVPSGSRKEIELQVSESFAGTSVALSVVVVHGREPGPVLCLIAGIHGDELNGTEIVRSALDQVEPERLSGVLIGVPIVNVHGFRSRTRYLPDRRDLNRHFPGSPRGSSASRIATRLFDGVIRRCQYLVDFHTGSHHRANLTQVRGDLEQPRILDLARKIGPAVVIHHAGKVGTLRRAAADVGIPSILYEAGEPWRLQPEEVQRGVEHVRRLFGELGMAPPVEEGPGSQVFRATRWVRVDHGGIFVPRVQLGDTVERDQVLATIFDPIGGERALLRSPRVGRIIGMAVPQVVIPGFAAFHLGLSTREPGISEDLGIMADEEDPE